MCSLALILAACRSHASRWRSRRSRVLFWNLVWLGEALQAASTDLLDLPLDFSLHAPMIPLHHPALRHRSAAPVFCSRVLHFHPLVDSK